MSLQVKHGDVFAAVQPGQILAHGCNMQGVMGSGVAKIVKERYWKAWQAYYMAHRLNMLALGKVQFAKVDNDIVVANCITQEYYGRDPAYRYVSYQAVEFCMERVAEMARHTESAVHLPFIGGGRANGDRNKLLPIFESAFHNVEATLWLQED